MNGRMKSARYQTPEQTEQLLKELVAEPSVTESAAEIAIAKNVYDRLLLFPYLAEHPGQLAQYGVGEGRTLVAALALAPMKTMRTVVVIAHFDVVDIVEYGTYASLAFQMHEWTDRIRRGQVAMPEQVKVDLLAGEWLFGRGVMDMKCGLAQNISLLEQACNGDFEGNLLFLAVPDEERHSDGMRAAAPLLVKWARAFELEYALCIDTEPSVVANTASDGALLYSGTMGKLLVGALCIGKETHVEAPFEGLSGTLMIGEVTRALELHPRLTERVGREQTAPVTCLYSRDQKTCYSVQTPYKAAAYYNVLFMQRTPLEWLAVMKELTEEAMASLAEWLDRRIAENGVETPNLAKAVHVHTFAEVLAYVCDRYPEVADAAQAILYSEKRDLRDATLAYVDAIASACKEWQPLIVLFVAPPFYPAIASALQPTVRRVIAAVQAVARERYQMDVKEQVYFPGLSDLSYVGIGDSGLGMAELAAHMPLWEKGYSLPVAELRQLEIPVLNIGPYGKDAHKWTERLERHYSLHVLPELLRAALIAVFA